MKEKDLKIKEKKDTLKVSDRNNRALGHRNNHINTGMKAAFIRNAAESRTRTQEDSGNSAANDAVETYETAAASIGRYGAESLKKAFRLEKSGARQEQSRQREKENKSGGAEPPLLDNVETALENTGKSFHEAVTAQGQSVEVPDTVRQGSGRNVPEMQLKETVRKERLQGGTVHRQGAKGYLRTEAEYPQRNPVYPQENLLKRDFLKKHRWKWESRWTQKYGQIQQYPNRKNVNPSPALPYSAGHGTDSYGTAGGRDKYKAVKKTQLC